MNANGSTNGHATPTPSREQVKQARLRNAMLEAELRGQLLQRVHKQAQHELRESYSDVWVNALNDRLDRYRGDPNGYGFSRYWDRRHGRFAPIFQTEMELNLLRAQSRVLCRTNGYGIGLIGGLSAYVIGTGYAYQAASKDKDRPASPELLSAVQRIVDSFLERVKWHGGEQPSLEEELFTRSIEDGEFFLLHFADEDQLDIQVYEPEQITQQPGERFETHGFGIISEENRPSKPLSYWLTPTANAADGDEYAPDQVTHFRRNVPQNVKRGVPDVAFDTSDGLRIASKLRRNMGLGAAVQAAYAVIRQHAPGVTSEQASDLRGLLNDFTRTRSEESGSRTDYYQKIEPGIYDCPAGMQYAQPPNAQNAGAHVQIHQAVLRGVGQRWNAPEWISSADASNNNYSSALVADSPFVIRVKAEQNGYKAVFLRPVVQSVKVYVEYHGRLVVREAMEGGVQAERSYTWRDIQELVDIQVNAPSPETRNKLEEAQVNQVYASLKIKSPQTIQGELDLDKDEEAANWQEWDEKFGQQGGGAEQAPPEEPPAEPEPPAAAEEANPVAGLSDEEIDAMSDEDLAALFSEEEVAESLLEAPALPSAKAPTLGGGKKGMGGAAKAKQGFTGKRKEGKRVVCRSQGKLVPCPPEGGKDKAGTADKAGKGKTAKAGGGVGAGLGDLLGQAVGRGAEAAAKFGLQGDVRGALNTATEFDAPKAGAAQKADKPAKAKAVKAKQASTKAGKLAAKTKDPAQKAKLAKVAKRLEDHSADITAAAMSQKVSPQQAAPQERRGQAGAPMPAGVSGTAAQMAKARGQAAALSAWNKDYDPRIRGADREAERRDPNLKRGKGVGLGDSKTYAADADATQLLESTIATHLRQLSEQYDGTARVVAEAAARVLEAESAVRECDQGVNKGKPGPCPSGKPESPSTGVDKETDADRMALGGGAMSQAEAKERVSAAVADYVARWQEFANGSHQLQISHPVHRRSMGVILVRPDGGIELNDKAKENFGDVLGGLVSSPPQKETEPVKPPEPRKSRYHGTAVDGGWTTTKAGSSAAVVSAEDVGLRITKSGNVAKSNFGSIAEGDEIEVAGRKFSVEAIGSPFRSRGGETLVYLYPKKPSRRVYVPREEPPDDPMDRMRWEQEREQGRTGELPGA